MIWKVPKYILELEKDLSQLSLLDLVDRVVEMSPGDDHDGLFTTRGYNEFEKAKKVLDKRIREVVEYLKYWHNKGTKGALSHNDSAHLFMCGTCPLLDNIERKREQQ